MLTLAFFGCILYLMFLLVIIISFVQHIECHLCMKWSIKNTFTVPNLSVKHVKATALIDHTANDNEAASWLNLSRI